TVLRAFSLPATAAAKRRWEAFDDGDGEEERDGGGDEGGRETEWCGRRRAIEAERRSETMGSRGGRRWPRQTTTTRTEMEEPAAMQKRGRKRWRKKRKWMGLVAVAR
uniref:Uncharacterized protein n=1 Tax=Cucumis melo TaxID=3656 RepID=A0A9I9CCV4_CUCME